MKNHNYCRVCILKLVQNNPFQTLQHYICTRNSACCVAVDNSCHGSGSRRSSRAAAATRSRHSSVTSALLRQQANLHQHRKSTDTAISLGSGSCSRSTGRRRHTSGCGDVPGIEISRIDTVDFDDGSLLATCSGKHGYGGSGSKQRFIFINRYASDVAWF